MLSVDLRLGGTRRESRLQQSLNERRPRGREGSRGGEDARGEEDAAGWFGGRCRKCGGVERGLRGGGGGGIGSGGGEVGGEEEGVDLGEELEGLTLRSRKSTDISPSCP